MGVGVSQMERKMRGSFSPELEGKTMQKDSEKKVGRGSPCAVFYGLEGMFASTTTCSPTKIQHTGFYQNLI